MLVDFAILRKLFPYLNFVAIGLSVAKLMLFYKAFGINIIQYLDLSESIILFFDDILYFFLFILLIIISSVFFLHKVGDSNTEDSNKIIEKASLRLRFAAFVKTNIPQILFSIYCAWWIQNYFVLFTILLLYLLTEIRSILIRRYNTDLNVTYHNIILWGVAFVFVAFQRVQYNIKAVRDDLVYQGTSLQVDKVEQNIVSDSTTIYLGKTKDYFYLYDKKKQSAVIIPSSEVLRVDLKNKYRGVLGF